MRLPAILAALAMTASMAFSTAAPAVAKSKKPHCKRGYVVKHNRCVRKPPVQHIQQQG
jgi:hypothetical protein